MLGRLAALCAAFATAACVSAEPPRAPAPHRAEVVEAPPVAVTGARFVHALGDDTFWVSHAPDLDRVIAGGARLETLPSGEVRAAAWDVDLFARVDPLTGALAVPDRLGGGFVFWTRGRVFRAREFTGKLDPVPLGVPGEVHVRGARAGLRSVVVLTDAGPRELRPGGDRLTAFPVPAVFDMVAVSAARAARLDVFGRASVTGDGGATWTDLSPAAGLGVTRIVAGESDLWIENAFGRALVTPAGALGPVDSNANRSGDYDTPRTLQTLWKGTRATAREDLPWTLRDTTPLELAVSAGAAVGDGTAFGVTRGAVVRVDLRTGAVRSIVEDWFPNGLACQAVRAADGVLFACVWDRSSGDGGYVFRSVGGAPPRIEKVFTDNGAFVADDEGALGFLGSCRAEARSVDLNDRSRYDDGDAPLPPVLCVRRGSGAWVERRVEVGKTDQLVAWAARRDGTASAFVASGDPLPPPVGAPRVVEAAGVRVVRVYREIPGWTLARLPSLPDRGFVDRRFHARDDGSVDAWLTPSDGPVVGVVRGVTFEPAGVPTAYPLPPGALSIVSGGDFALSLTREGDLQETTDHGRTYRPAGRSPTPPASSAGMSCSALGCALGPVLRVGWGPDLAPLEARIFRDPLPVAAPVAVPRLRCVPGGAPTPLLAPPRVTSAEQTLVTPWGDAVQIVRDTPPSEPPTPRPSRHTSRIQPSSSQAPSSQAPPSPSARLLAARHPRASPAVLRTHSLWMRPPFAPFAPLRRVDATDLDGGLKGRVVIVPLLTPTWDVTLLVYSDPHEILIAGDRVTVLPSPENPQYSRRDGDLTGLTLPGDRALVLEDERRQLTLEEHGPGVPIPPVYLGLPREPPRQRPLALARRDDGALGVLVLDGADPEGAGVAPLDRLAAAASPAVRLAPWSTLLTADDPRCLREDDPGAYRAIVLFHPGLWLALDPAALPGLSLGSRGMMRVRWGVKRVCLEAVELGLSDPGKQRGEVARWVSLVARWAGEKQDRGAVLRALDLRQDLVCTVAPAVEGKPP